MSGAAPFLIFVHGWGLDQSVWTPLRGALSEIDSGAVDLGFFGAPSNPPCPAGRPLVAVGHSLGTLWLLCRDHSDWAAFVAINGFPRFTMTPDYRPAIDRRVLDRMIARFDIMPEAVIEEFRLRSGARIDVPGTPDLIRLREHLLALRDWDGRDRLKTLDIPVLALAGGRDPIVPPAMSEHAFADATRLELAWRPDGGHMLPIDDAPWCADQIRGFLSDAGLVS
jgi:pimeloyl-[acyl-carrier protein] methyl ester esterase